MNLSGFDEYSNNLPSPLSVFEEHPIRDEAPSSINSMEIQDPSSNSDEVPEPGPNRIPHAMNPQSGTKRTRSRKTTDSLKQLRNWLGNFENNIRNEQHRELRNQFQKRKRKLKQYEEHQLFSDLNQHFFGNRTFQTTKVDLLRLAVTALRRK